MSYKVFLVEDEIVAREGIRDNVNWQAAGFEFCGEAPDGEIALPLIQKSQPDVIITDIKMPFMDGLQLCKLVRQQMPWVKIIILSGHDEFDYAQSAIKLGVTEYLLKPISAREIQSVLQSVATALDQETEERENLQALQSQIKDVLALQRERLLLQLVVGGVSSTAAIEQCRQIGLDIIAQPYLVILIKVHLHEDHALVDFARYHEIQRMVANLVNKHSGAFFTQKSVEELLLIMTGEDAEQLKQDGLFLAGLVQQDIEAETGYRVAGVGGGGGKGPTEHFLFFAAAVNGRNPIPRQQNPLPTKPPGKNAQIRNIGR